MGVLTCLGCGQRSHQHGSMYLHDDGTVVCVIDGVHHLTNTPEPGDLHCDWCNAKGVTWRAITNSRVTADMMTYDPDTLEPGRTQTHNMDEDWATCDRCKRLIEAGKWERLAWLAIMSAESTSQRTMPDETREQLYGAMRELHQTVWQGFVKWERETGEA